MSEEMQIEVVTYERERLDYFTELMQLARTRYSLLYHKFKDAPYMSEEHQMLSDMGREVQFFGDVVEMLENGYRKQSGWISADNPPKTYRDEYGELIPFLVCCRGTVHPFRAMYDGKNWGDGIGRLNVTHWMPLPEPPVMKGGE